MLGENGLIFFFQEEKSYQNDELIFLEIVKDLKMQASVIKSSTHLLLNLPRSGDGMKIIQLIQTLKIRRFLQLGD